MKVHRHARLCQFPQGCVATIGNFDGVHLGHQAIIKQLLDKAQHLNLPSLVIVFEPQPLEFFKPEIAPARLTRLREKLYFLAKTQVEHVLVLPFNAVLAKMTAKDFVQQLLVQQLNLSYLIIGDDFRFGYQRQGDFELLQQLGHLYDFSVKDSRSFLLEGERVSSTWVRQSLQLGDLVTVEKLLGRKYSLSGRVSHGDKLGRELGFPTANIFLHRNKSPALGIYAVRMNGITTRPILGTAYIGSRPTINGSTVLLEVFLFNFDKNIYGAHAQVDLLHKLRDDQRFESLEQLKAQIAVDVNDAKAYFAGS